jgi:ubiquinone/menaquinone biosynthesis C-methylase UbiE
LGRQQGPARETQIEMQIKKVDYTRISQCYDETRVPLIQDTLKFCLSKISDLGKITGDSKVLDVGCGTGIYTIPLAERTNASVVGIDSSKDMIEQAVKKEDSKRIEWLIGNAEDLPFNNARFDCVFMTMVIHQIVNKKMAISEILRVLKGNGRFVIMTKSHGQLKRSLIMTFPKITQIDLKRFPTIPELRNMLLSAGFRNTRYYVESAGTENISIPDYLEKIRKKFISTLTLLSEEDFQKGLEVFERKLTDRWADKTAKETISREYTFVVAS